MLWYPDQITLWIKQNNINPNHTGCSFNESSQCIIFHYHIYAGEETHVHTLQAGNTRCHTHVFEDCTFFMWFVFDLCYIHLFSKFVNGVDLVTVLADFHSWILYDANIGSISGTQHALSANMLSTGYPQAPHRAYTGSAQRKPRLHSAQTQTPHKENKH